MLAAPESSPTVTRVIALMASLAVAATACTSGDSGDSPTTTPVPVDTSPTTTTVAADGMVVPVVRLPATGEVIYFVMTDRFENGDPTNDTGGLEPESSALLHGYLPSDTGFYHGGDIAGLSRRLDYIQGLGASAIWVTPPFTNRTVQGNGTVSGSSAGYHGYWQTDFTIIDPHFGTNDEMKRFVEAAHDRGLRVYFDAVANHTGDVITFAEDSFAYRPAQNWPFLDAAGEPFDESSFAGTDDFPELDASTSFAYTPLFASAADATAKAPDWLNDPVYYHNRGNSTFSGESSLSGDFFGLDDLFTEHPDVVAGMTDIYQSAIRSYGIDGFRVDTVKHVNDEFWEAFIPGLYETAQNLGDEDLFVFGEVFSSDPLLRSHYTTNGPFPSVLDFGFSDAATDFAAEGEAPTGLADLFEDDDWFTDEDSNASMLVKFIGNHDEGRLGGFVGTANPRADDAELVRRVSLAMELMFTTRGIPVVYYGDEQGFVGDGGDQGARQDMFPSRVDSYNDDDLIGTDATTAADNFDAQHPLYQLIANLAELRRAHPALETGAHITRLAEDQAGVYAFSRIDRTERIEYVVAANNAAEARSVAIDVATPEVSFSGIYPATTSAINSTSDGTLEVTVPALSAVVYRAQSPVAPSLSAPAVMITRPSSSAEVAFERFRIEAALDRDAFVEVTFSVSLDGGEFQLVGTDDGPPYRVFWDRGDAAAGTQVEVMATVDDLSGHRSMALSRFTLG